MQTEIFLAAADVFLCLFQIVGDCFLLRHHEVRKRSLSSSPVHHSLLKNEDKVSEMDISHFLQVHRASIYVFFPCWYMLSCVTTYEYMRTSSSARQNSKLDDIVVRSPTVFRQRANQSKADKQLNPRPDRGGVGATPPPEVFRR